VRHSGWGWRAVEQTFAKMPRGSEVNKTTKVQKSCYIQSRSSIVCKRDHRCLHMRKIWIDENVAVNMSMSLVRNHKIGVLLLTHLCSHLQCTKASYIKDRSGTGVLMSLEQLLLLPRSSNMIEHLGAAEKESLNIWSQQTACIEIQNSRYD